MAHDDDYNDQVVNAFFKNPMAVLGQVSATTTQQALVNWDRNRAREYALNNPDIIRNQGKIDDIMNRNQLNRNYEGLKLAHRILKGEARDEEAHYRQQEEALGEAGHDDEPPETPKPPTPQELADKYGIGNIPADELDAAIDAHAEPEEDAD